LLLRLPQAHINNETVSQSPLVLDSHAAHDDSQHTSEDLDMFPLKPKLRWLKVLAAGLCKDVLRAVFEEEMHEVSAAGQSHA
jgi:hypothetical protein